MLTVWEVEFCFTTVMFTKPLDSDTVYEVGSNLNIKTGDEQGEINCSIGQVGNPYFCSYGNRTLSH